MERGVVILTGPTGCGKSTQVPIRILKDILDNNKYKRVIVSQPRKSAAISLAHYIKKNDQKISELVSFNFNSRDLVCISKWPIAKGPRLIFTSESALFDYSIQIPDFTGFSIVIIDEAHERTLYTDLLLGVIKKTCSYPEDDERNKIPLRAIIMSATINTIDFFQFFENCPSIKISKDSSYPVDIFYDEDIFSNFISDSREVMSNICKFDFSPSDTAISIVGRCIETISLILFNPDKFKECTSILVFLATTAHINMACHSMNEWLNKFWKNQNQKHNYKVIPFHGSIDPDIMDSIIRPKEGMNNHRIIFSTNIAETSLTIQGISHVIDCGFVKQNTFDQNNGFSSLNVTWISKSSAQQRAGRAGRTSHGVCLRLYSKQSYNNMDQFTKPEILRIHLGLVILKLYQSGITDPCSFPFISPPPIESFKSAQLDMFFLKALSVKNDDTPYSDLPNRRLYHGSIADLYTKVDDDDDNSDTNSFLTNSQRLYLTPLGRLMCHFDIPPHITKLIVQGTHEGCAKSAITAAAMILVARTPFLIGTTESEHELNHMRSGSFYCKHSDLQSFITMYNESRKQNKSHSIMKSALVRIEETEKFFHLDNDSDISPCNNTSLNSENTNTIDKDYEKKKHNMLFINAINKIRFYQNEYKPYNMLPSQYLSNMSNNHNQNNFGIPYIINNEEDKSTSTTIYDVIKKTCNHNINNIDYFNYNTIYEFKPTPKPSNNNNIFNPTPTSTSSSTNQNQNQSLSKWNRNNIDNFKITPTPTPKASLYKPTPKQPLLTKWCFEHSIDIQILEKAHNIRKHLVQTCKQIDISFKDIDRFKEDDDKYSKILRDISLSSFFTTLSILSSISNNELYYKYLIVKTGEVIYLHPSSYLRKFGEIPKWIVFTRKSHTSLPFAINAVSIDPELIEKLVPKSFLYCGGADYKSIDLKCLNYHTLDEFNLNVSATFILQQLMGRMNQLISYLENKSNSFIKNILHKKNKITVLTKKHNIPKCIEIFTQEINDLKDDINEAVFYYQIATGTRALIGPGCQLKRILFHPESCEVHIKLNPNWNPYKNENETRKATNRNRKNFLQWLCKSQNLDLLSCRIITVEESLTAHLVFTTPRKAEIACKFFGSLFGDDSLFISSTLYTSSSTSPGTDEVLPSTYNLTQKLYFQWVTGIHMRKAIVVFLNNNIAKKALQVLIDDFPNSYIRNFPPYNQISIEPIPKNMDETLLYEMVDEKGFNPLSLYVKRRPCTSSRNNNSLSLSNLSLSQMRNNISNFASCVDDFYDNGFHSYDLNTSDLIICDTYSPDDYVSTPEDKMSIFDFDNELSKSKFQESNPVFGQDNAPPISGIYEQISKTNIDELIELKEAAEDIESDDSDDSDHRYLTEAMEYFQPIDIQLFSDKKPNHIYWDAIITYKNSSAAWEACDLLNRRKVPFSTEPVKVTLYYSVKLPIKKYIIDKLPTLEKTLLSLARQVSHPPTNVILKKNPNESDIWGNIVIRTHNAITLSQLQWKFDEILSGKLLSDELTNQLFKFSKTFSTLSNNKLKIELDSDNNNNYSATTSLLDHIKTLERKCNVAIKINDINKTIRVIGETEYNVDEAIEMLESYANTLSHLKYKCEISVPPLFLKNEILVERKENENQGNLLERLKSSYHDYTSKIDEQNNTITFIGRGDKIKSIHDCILRAIASFNRQYNNKNNNNETQNTKDIINHNSQNQKRFCLSCHEDNNELLYTLSSCGHTFCRECISNMITAFTDEGKFPLSCFLKQNNNPCPPLSIADIKEVLKTKKQLDYVLYHSLRFYITSHQPPSNKYNNNFSDFSTTLSDSNYIVSCPTPDCPQLFPYSIDLDFSNRQQEITCSECRITYCVKCRRRFHPDRYCDGKVVPLEAYGVKMCPGCNVPTSKSGGCNHMKCQNCGAHWCWLCSKSFPTSKEVYDHMSQSHVAGSN